MLIPERFIPKIGEIALAFSDLDREIIYSIWFILKCSPQIGTVITKNINSPTTRVTILRELAEVALTNQEELKQFKKLLDAFCQSNIQRNILFHDQPYWHSPSTGTVGYFKNIFSHKPKAPTEINDQWLHELLICIRLQTNIFKQFRGEYIVENEHWSKAEIPVPN